MNKIHLETVGSTNSYLKEHHRDMVDFSYVWATHQTSGHGRLGRTWQDDGKSALFSLLLKTDIPVDLADRIPLLAAVAVHKTVGNYVQNVQIKWPNDILVRGLKLAGILVESVIEGSRILAVVVGIGINVNNDSFPDELKSIATSLFLETGREHKIENLIDEVVRVFELQYRRFRRGSQDYVDYCNKYSSLAGKVIAFRKGDQTKEGIAGKMLPDGSLRVDTPEGPLFLRSGEVTIMK